MIPVGWLAPSVDCWDSNMLARLFANELYPTGLEFRRVLGYPNEDGCVLLIPGRYWVDHYAEISEALHRYEWVLAVRTSDEEDLFDVSAVSHPNIRWWVQSPRADRDYGAARLFGIGFPPHFNDLSTDAPVKDMDVCLVAQDTHARRHECFEALQRTKGSQFVKATAGFTQGYSPGDYAFQMMQAKVAPAPSGAVSPDSFRLFEALEAHCVPIADSVSPVDGHTNYWQRLFGEVPFPVITDYADLPGYIEDALTGWPANANRITAWWMRYKRQLRDWLVEDLTVLGAV